MSEIIQHHDPAGFAAHFHPSFDSLERIQTGLDLGVGQAERPRTNNHRGGVAPVMLARQRTAEPFGRGRLEPVRRAERAAGDFVDLGVAGAGDQATALGDDGDQLAKRAFDRGEIGKDIGMIKLDIVQDHRIRLVMNELATLVEKRRVVLVTLDHEYRPVAQPATGTEIERDPTDEKAGGEPGGFEHPGQERGGGGFAMGAGHDHDMAPGQQQLAHQLGQRTER